MKFITLKSTVEYQGADSSTKKQRELFFDQLTY